MIDRSHPDPGKSWDVAHETQSCAGQGEHDLPLGVHDFVLEGDQARPHVDEKYVLFERVGQGGMGTVWKAQQLTPVKRIVAIKVLRHSSQTSSTLSRFATEQQVLATMNHPHIAQVFDGGLCDDRTPYLVMEFVEGTPLNEFCDHHGCTIPQRLRLFIKICLAVEHAHQRGIIHRDLKPSNVLVTQSDGLPIPKVIDFGLAKALPWSECVGSSAEMSLPGVAIGTPSYMSPEQIASSESQVDTRADIYALGVMLYEIATGELPFSPCRTEAGGWVQTLQMILHQEPQRPSHRAGISPQEPAAAIARGLQPGRLSSAIRGDLEWIVLKSLAKQPADRYACVADLRHDIENLLSHHPIQARPSSLAYRVVRFVRRHQLLVSLAVLIALTTISGLATSTWGLLRARAAEADALLALQKERTANERARRAVDALAEAMMYADFIDPGDEHALLQQVLTLHELASDEEVTHAHFEWLNDLPVPHDASERARTYRRVLDVLEHIDHEQPIPASRSVMINVRFWLAQLLEATGKQDQAIAEYRQCEKELLRFMADEPTNVHYPIRFSEVQTRLNHVPAVPNLHRNDSDRSASPTGN